jgi:hypothetical protein
MQIRSLRPWFGDPVFVVQALEIEAVLDFGSGTGHEVAVCVQTDLPSIHAENDRV